VESAASKDYLHFAEVEVYVAGKNVAVGKPVKASSTMGRFTPEKAVDGIVEYTWGENASLWSSAGRGNQWWELDLGGELPIEKVVLYNRLDCCQERLAGAALTVLGANRQTVGRMAIDDTAVNPLALTFFERPLPPVNLAAQTVAERMAALAPRFTAPSKDTAYVMPVGSGDLSAMLRYDEAWEIHLSKTDFFVPDNIAAPGHVRLSFGVAADAVRKFEQRIDLERGSVVLNIETATGNIAAEAFGVMGQNTLLIAVDDMRPEAAVSAEFSVWRPAMQVAAANGIVKARQVHDFDERRKRVEDPAKVSPSDRLFNLGAGVALALGGPDGVLPAVEVSSGAPTNRSATLRAKTARRYWLAISCATTYDGAPEAAAERLLRSAVNADKTRLLNEHLAWWQQFWDASFIDLYGPGADYLARLWYVTLYSYASVGDSPVLPKFNGGPGLIHEDDRHWGWAYWWQNTRIVFWPMFAANHLRYARKHIDFYDRTFRDYKQRTANSGKIGIRVWEDATPFKPGTTVPAKVISPFDPAALQKAVADTRMESVASHYNARSMAQGAELVQQLFDYVAFTGDTEFLKSVVSPWLKEVSLFYLSYLKLEADGRYHMTPSDAVEMWWKVKDPMTDMCAVRYCFWKVLNHGAEFGYEPAFLETVRERLAKLAPLPAGRWPRRVATQADIPPGRPSYIKPGSRMVDRIEPDDTQYAPAASFLADRIAYNAEQPELYVIYPFALADAQSPAEDFARAVNTFKARQDSNTYGWSQDGIQAARLRLDDTVRVIIDHARRHQRYPYGGWVNAAVPLKGSKLNLSDVPYFDTAGVQMTALQETLLQSHVLTAPGKTDPLTGGPIVLLPAVPKDWAGRFKLRARGGFLVTVEFQPGRRVERVVVESERGQTLTLANPFPKGCVFKGGKQLLSTKDSVIRLPTQKGEVLEFVDSPSPNP